MTLCCRLTKASASATERPPIASNARSLVFHVAVTAEISHLYTLQCSGLLQVQGKARTCRALLGDPGSHDTRRHIMIPSPVYLTLWSDRPESSFIWGTSGT